jgi:hypothetical protein
VDHLSESGYVQSSFEAFFFRRTKITTTFFDTCLPFCVTNWYTIVLLNGTQLESYQ